MAADPAGLDVDDAARPGRERICRLTGRVQRFVEADGRTNRRLERGVIADVVVVERLLDHHEIVGVELRQVGPVAELVGGVRIDHQRNRTEAGAHDVDGLDVPARLDLDLDATITRLAFDGDALEQLVERVLDPNRHARFDAARDPFRGAPEHLGKRTPLSAREQVPGGHFDRRFRHVVAADRAERREDIAGMREVVAEHERRDEVRDDVPGGPCGLGAVERVGVRHALAEPDGAVLLDRDDHERAIVDPAEAGFEEANERQPQHPQLDPLDPHDGQCYRNRSWAFAILPRPLSTLLDFRYIAIEGPTGVGKSLLADRLGSRLDATVVLDETENPFLPDFYAERPGAGFQAQLFYTLSRHRQQSALRQSDLFSQLTICDYLFDRDKIYAYLNLDDNELFIYQRLYELLAADMPSPDLVIYLQTPTDVLKRRLRERERANPDLPPLGDDYVRELNEAYNHFFFHYNATPLLVVETSQFDLSWGEEALADLEKQLRSMGRGTRYYVPRT